MIIGALSSTSFIEILISWIVEFSTSVAITVKLYSCFDSKSGAELKDNIPVTEFISSPEELKPERE